MYNLVLHVPWTPPPPSKKVKPPSILTNLTCNLKIEYSREIFLEGGMGEGSIIIIRGQGYIMQCREE